MGGLAGKGFISLLCVCRPGSVSVKEKRQKKQEVVLIRGVHADVVAVFVC